MAIFLFSALAVVSGTNPPVGSHVDVSTWDIYVGARVDGPASAFQCLAAWARDVSYGSNRRVDLRNSVVELELGRCIFGTFCHREALVGW